MTPWSFRQSYRRYLRYSDLTAAKIKTVDILDATWCSVIPTFRRDMILPSSWAERGKLYVIMDKKSTVLHFLSYTPQLPFPYTPTSFPIQPSTTWTEISLVQWRCGRDSDKYLLPARYTFWLYNRILMTLCSIKTEDMSYVINYCYCKSGVKNYVRGQTKLSNLSLKV